MLLPWITQNRTTSSPCCRAWKTLEGWRTKLAATPMMTYLSPPLPTLSTSSHIPIRLLYVGIGGMSYRRSGLSFDAIDRPACPYCGALDYLTRRSPHPDHDLRYELQVFSCSACDHTIERIVDANGNSPEKLNCCD